MNEAVKTIVFVVIAGVLGLLALGVHLWTKPKENKQFALVGEEFYPEFRNAREATFLEVAAIEKEGGKVQSFRVEKIDGLWRIPSHYGYPAEAAERLAETATSVIGIKREALAGRKKSEHERFGVVDPLSEEAKPDETTGRRIKLGSGDETMADYIVGKQVDEGSELPDSRRERSGQEDDDDSPLYYVRRPEEDETFKARFEVEVSTNFSDWIDPDLLRMDESDIQEFLINKYDLKYVDVLQRTRDGRIFPGKRATKTDAETQKLSRDFGQWKLDGLDEETEELETSKISTIARSLSNLKILGVRPRPQLNGHQMLGPDLQLTVPNDDSIDPESINEALNEMRRDLQDKGFNLGPSEDDEEELALISDRGDMTVATNEGLIYKLYFGKEFVGTDEQIEIGGAKSVEDDKGEDDKDSDESEKDDANSKSDKDEEKSNKSRILLISVSFDPDRMEGKPIEPVKPVAPKKPDESTEKNDQKKPSTTPPPNLSPDKLDGDETKNDKEDDSDEKEDKKQDETSEKSDATESEDSNNSNDTNESSEEGSDCDAIQDEQESTETESDKTDDSEEEEKTDEHKSDGDTKDNSNDKADNEKSDVSNEEKADQSKDDTKSEEAANESENGKNEPSTDAESETDEPTADDIYKQALADYQRQMQQYVIDMEQYKSDLKDFEEKVEENRSKAEELIERFGSWYYLVPADNLEDIRLGRADLVKAKPKEEENKTEQNQPNIPGLNPLKGIESLIPNGNSNKEETNKEETNKEETGKEETDTQSENSEEKGGDKDQSTEESPTNENGADSETKNDDSASELKDEQEEDAESKDTTEAAE